MKTLILILLSLPGDVSAFQETGSIRGTVKLNGERPKPKGIKISCPDCAPLYPTGMPREDLIVDEHHFVQSAVVYIQAGLEGRKFEVPEQPVVLEQKGCRYEPPVAGVRVGQKVLIRNRDPHVHCIHGITQVNPGINVPLQAGKDFEVVFQRQEIPVILKDDIFPWMKSRLAVFDHPFFAVTGPGGRFEIPGLPPGKYTLGVWQERCAPLARHLEVKASEPQELELVLDLKE